MIKPILIIILSSLILICAFSAHIFPFTTDSHIYISTAQNMNSGKGLVFDNIFVQPPGPDVLPLKLYTPGYSFLIAALEKCGVDVYTAALIIPRFFFLLLPIGFFLLFKQVMPKKLAMVTVVLCTFMFPYLQCALMAWTDIPFLFLSLISFYYIFKIARSQDKEQFMYAFSSGIFTGCSLLLRNVGYALFFSIGWGFLLMLIMRMIGFKTFLKLIAMYIIGFAILILPYLIRNYLVFGWLNPYRLPPANYTLVENLVNYSHALSRIILINSSNYIILFILMVGMLALFIGSLKSMGESDKPKVFCVFVLMIYFLSGSFLLILAKTIYFGPESINERYLIQYAWIIMMGLSYCIYSLLSKLSKKKPMDTKAITFFILLAFVLIQVFPAADFYFQQDRILNTAKKVKANISIFARIPEDHVIVTNVMDMSAYFSRRNIRLLNGYLPSCLRRILGSKRKFAVFIIKERSQDYKAYLYPPFWLNPEGYREVYSNKDVVLWAPK